MPIHRRDVLRLGALGAAAVANTAWPAASVASNAAASNAETKNDTTVARADKPLDLLIFGGCDVPPLSVAGLFGVRG